MRIEDSLEVTSKNTDAVVYTSNKKDPMIEKIEVISSDSLPKDQSSKMQLKKRIHLQPHEIRQEAAHPFYTIWWQKPDSSSYDKKYLNLKEKFRFRSSGNQSFYELYENF